MPDPFEKTPKNWRMNHKDFKDVYETTFAKGTIKEFQKYKLADDWIVEQVESMVKVDIDGQESDFIPLFFRPKDQYFDDYDQKLPDAPDYSWVNRLAKDYDKDNKCYPAAWTSFRPGDEVVVLLQAGEPKAVLGFYDGYPRLAEAAFNVGGHFFYFPFMRHYGALPWEFAQADIPTLPDKEKLGLKYEAEKFLTVTGGGRKVRTYALRVDSDILCDVKGGPPENGYIIYGTDASWSRAEYFKFTAGPYMYIVCIGGSCIGGEIQYPGEWAPRDTLPFDLDVHQYGIDCDLINSEHFHLDACPMPDPNYGVAAWVALYDKEKYDNIKIEWFTGGDYPVVNGFPDFQYISLPESDFGAEDPGDKVLVRPHTKEELQAAGMWPDLGQ